MMAIRGLKVKTSPPLLCWCSTQYSCRSLASSFTKNSIPVLRVDAQITVIDAALKGYLKWVSNLGEEPQQNVRISSYAFRWKLNSVSRSAITTACKTSLRIGVEM